MTETPETKHKNQALVAKGASSPNHATCDTVANDSAVSIKVSSPCAWDLEQLNLAISNLNTATATVEKIGELVKSLDGFHQQLASPSAKPRHTALLQSEAEEINAELSRTLQDESLLPFGKIELASRGDNTAVTKKRIDAAQKYSTELKSTIEHKRADLNHELAILETAHLNSESSLSAVRDLDCALKLVTSARTAVTKNPSHAVEACGALGARAKSLLLNG